MVAGIAVLAGMVVIGAHTTIDVETSSPR